MFKNKVIRWSTIAMLLAIVGYFIIENFPGNLSNSDKDDLAASNPEQYKANVMKQRADKDELFRTTSDSPIADKASFHGLHYFGPDPSYRVKANITPYTKDDKEMVVTYTDGTTEEYERYGYAHFTVNGESQKLLLLKKESVISILFKDATSGKQTYGGGRYLDYPVSDIKNNTMTLDFNEAYNPYCVYQESYACPVPPAENTLSVAIPAGEQTEQSAH